VTLSLSLDPSIELPDENEEDYYPGAEPSSLLVSGADWVRTCKKKKTEHGANLKLFGENIDG